MPMDEACNKTLEMPGSGTKLPEQHGSKTHHNNKNNQTDTPPQIPSITPQIPEKNAESNKKDKI